jgi:two-component system response regulator FlrC
MRVLIVGAHSHEIVSAIQMAVQRGATLRHVLSPDVALDELCAGRGADLILIDVAADIARLIRASRQSGSSCR